MNEDQHLKEALSRPDVPDDLEAQIRRNWQQQLGKKQTKRGLNQPWHTWVAGIIFCVVSLSVFVMQRPNWQSNVVPGLVSAAIEDIEKDKRIGAGISVQPKEWLSRYHINEPPQTMAVKLSKNCYIDGAKSLHLLVATENHGEVHLFLRLGRFDAQDWASRQGSVSSMPWRLIQPRDGLSVLIVYTQQVNQKRIENLVETMFAV